MLKEPCLLIVVQFFHYSGHGGQQEDETGMEEDGLDETILPVDFQTSGQITDDTIHDILVRPLPAGVRMTAIFDSCHSQTAMDLPYVYHAEESVSSISFWKHRLTFIRNTRQRTRKMMVGSLGGMWH